MKTITCSILLKKSKYIEKEKKMIISLTDELNFFLMI